MTATIPDRDRRWLDNHGVGSGLSMLPAIEQRQAYMDAIALWTGL